MLCGIFFSVGIVIFSKFIYPIFSDPNDIHREEIERVENEAGLSCKELHERAYAFSIQEIGKIISVGLDGGDWIAVITDEQKTYIDQTKEDLLSCSMAKSSARQLGYKWPDFWELHLLFSSLSTFSTRYGDGPASSTNLKPQALESLMFNYQNVTSLGKGTH